MSECPKRRVETECGRARIAQKQPASFAIEERDRVSGQGRARVRGVEPRDAVDRLESDG